MAASYALLLELPLSPPPFSRCEWSLCVSVACLEYAQEEDVLSHADDVRVLLDEVVVDEVGVQRVPAVSHAEHMYSPDEGGNGRGHTTLHKELAHRKATAGQTFHHGHVEAEQVPSAAVVH